MSKAYGRVEWDFFTRMMIRLGFHVDWVTLIMMCVASISYTVGINGGSSASFVPSRGLHQSDPFRFSAILDEAKETSSIRGFWAEGDYDKSLLYFGANVGEGEKILVVNILGVWVSTNPKKYLGLPMMVGKNKIQFRTRMESWNMRFLSLGRKECFLLPKT
ncbi:RNA-directed DNA polymerase [Gossypium australe]|uniref:RNA-directed DNA polymerase n=1 Tax=Gossypium australe TaxID=47621 RepID=A0A5B6WG82_9ROSI|nr:RNA-directed DNA polymerase [Gossypium australe]